LHQEREEKRREEKRREEKRGKKEEEEEGKRTGHEHDPLYPSIYAERSSPSSQNGVMRLDSNI
jgi:hypothetical protein